MHIENRIGYSLFLLRISVFIVMLVWTLDKFINPEHASKVYEKFYHLSGLASGLLYTIASIELIIIIMFFLGVKKKISYGAVLLFHTVSTISSYKQYLAPYDGANILFFAAWPMLGACLTLYLLRNHDTKFTLNKFT